MWDSCRNWVSISHDTGAFPAEISDDQPIQNTIFALDPWSPIYITQAALSNTAALGASV